jgi:hypothetical protein
MKYKYIKFIDYIFRFLSYSFHSLLRIWPVKNKKLKSFVQGSLDGRQVSSDLLATFKWRCALSSTIQSADAITSNPPTLD